MENQFNTFTNPQFDSTTSNSYEGTNYDFKIKKRFVSTETSYSGNKNGITVYDDPTYLGFSLQFNKNSPLFNGTILGNNNTNGSTSLDANSSNNINGEGLGGGISSAQKDSGSLILPRGESAFSYLKKIGKDIEAENLKAFAQGLFEINENRPYYWQSIEGLTEAWTKSFNMLDPFTGTTGTDGIKISCLEAIDLKISSLFSLYKSALYDTRYKRFMLPRNLMYFDVYVDVYEIRRFNTGRAVLNKAVLKEDDNNVKLFLNENTSKIRFRFSDCMWIPEESGEVFSDVSNAGTNSFAKTSMKWNYSSIEMQSTFSGFDKTIDESKINRSGNGISNEVDKRAKNNQTTDPKKIETHLDPKAPINLNKGTTVPRIENAINSLKNHVRKRVEGAVKSTLLGNAFGLRNNILSAIENPGILSRAIDEAVSQITNRNRNRNRNEPKLGENPLGSGAPQGNLNSENLYKNLPINNEPSLESSNLFQNRPSGPPPLGLDNVFE